MEIHNDSSDKTLRKPIPKIKTSIKECLQPKEITPFQTLMLEIRNNFILKVKNDKEPGKSCVQAENLPSNIDPVTTSFGTRQRYPFTVADIIHGNYTFNDSTHVPGEQINRKYEMPFSKHTIYGKVSNADQNGSKAKKLIHWFTETQNFRDSNYKLNKFNQPENIITNKLSDQYSVGIDEILHESPVNVKLIKMKKCLSHINTIRLQVKKRNSEIYFFTLKDHFHCIDKNNSNTVTLNQFYSILNKVKIKLNTEMFEYLLKDLDLIKGESIYFEEALNLLNWKYEFPEIPKIDDVPGKCLYYTTTYQDLMKV